MTAKEILNKHIQDYLAKNRMARFEDVPERVFIEAMEHYHQVKLKLLGIYTVVRRGGQLVCDCSNENWVYDESGVDMYCKNCEPK